MLEQRIFTKPTLVNFSNVRGEQVLQPPTIVDVVGYTEEQGTRRYNLRLPNGNQFKMWWADLSSNTRALPPTELPNKIVFSEVVATTPPDLPNRLQRNDWVYFRKAFGRIPAGMYGIVQARRNFNVEVKVLRLDTNVKIPDRLIAGGDSPIILHAKRADGDAPTVAEGDYVSTPDGTGIVQSITGAEVMVALDDKAEPQAYNIADVTLEVPSLVETKSKRHTLLEGLRDALHNMNSSRATSQEIYDALERNLPPGSDFNLLEQAGSLVYFLVTPDTFNGSASTAQFMDFDRRMADEGLIVDSADFTPSGVQLGIRIRSAMRVNFDGNKLADLHATNPELSWHDPDTLAAELDGFGSMYADQAEWIGQNPDEYADWALQMGWLEDEDMRSFRNVGEQYRVVAPCTAQLILEDVGTFVDLAEGDEILVINDLGDGKLEAEYTKPDGSGDAIYIDRRFLEKFTQPFVRSLGSAAVRYNVGETYATPYGFSYPDIEGVENITAEGAENYLELVERIEADEFLEAGWVCNLYEGYINTDNSISWSNPLQVLVSDEQLDMLQPADAVRTRRKINRSRPTGKRADSIYDIQVGDRVVLNSEVDTRLSFDLNLSPGDMGTVVNNSGTAVSIQFDGLTDDEGNPADPVRLYMEEIYQIDVVRSSRRYKGRRGVVRAQAPTRIEPTEAINVGDEITLAAGFDVYPANTLDVDNTPALYQSRGGEMARVIDIMPALDGSESLYLASLVPSRHAVFFFSSQTTRQGGKVTKLRSALRGGARQYMSLKPSRSQSRYWQARSDVEMVNYITGKKELVKRGTRLLEWETFRAWCGKSGTVLGSPTLNYHYQPFTADLTRFFKVAAERAGGAALDFLNEIAAYAYANNIGVDEYEIYPDEFGSALSTDQQDALLGELVTDGYLKGGAAGEGYALTTEGLAQTDFELEEGLLRAGFGIDTAGLDEPTDDVAYASIYEWQQGTGINVNEGDVISLDTIEDVPEIGTWFDTTYPNGDAPPEAYDCTVEKIDFENGDIDLRHNASSIQFTLFETDLKQSMTRALLPALDERVTFKETYVQPDNPNISASAGDSGYAIDYGTDYVIIQQANGGEIKVYDPDINRVLLWNSKIPGVTGEAGDPWVGLYEGRAARYAWDQPNADQVGKRVQISEPGNPWFGLEGFIIGAGTNQYNIKLDNGMLADAGIFEVTFRSVRAYVVGSPVTLEANTSLWGTADDAAFGDEEAAIATTEGEQTGEVVEVRDDGIAIVKLDDFSYTWVWAGDEPTTLSAVRYQVGDQFIVEAEYLETARPAVANGEPTYYGWQFGANQGDVITVLDTMDYPLPAEFSNSGIKLKLPEGHGWIWVEKPEFDNWLLDGAITPLTTTMSQHPTRDFSAITPGMFLTAEMDRTLQNPETGETFNAVEGYAYKVLHVDGDLVWLQCELVPEEQGVVQLADLAIGFTNDRKINPITGQPVDEYGRSAIGDSLTQQLKDEQVPYTSLEYDTESDEARINTDDPAAVVEWLTRQGYQELSEDGEAVIIANVTKRSEEA